MKRFVPGLLLLAFLPAAVQGADRLTTEQRLEKLERRVGKVTDLTLRLDAVQRENRQLRGDIETLQYQIQQLQRKQRDMYLDVDQRLSGMRAPAAAVPATAPAAADDSPASPAPAALAPVSDRNTARAPAGSVPPTAAFDAQKMQADYKAAYALLSPSQKRYEDAAKAFTVFLENYPGSTLAANAQYWLAEAYYVSQNNDPALQAFNKVISDYPSSPKVPGALYKIGRLESVKGNQAAARKALERVVAEYPTSSAAGLAKELLAKLKR